MKPRFLTKSIWTAWEPNGRKMTLLTPVEFQDSRGKVYTAPAGSVIDGSSIPRFFWRVIGSPYTGKHRMASVIHDVGCQQQWEDSPTVHRLYYEGLLAAGEHPWKAWLMWLAVRTFGPRWKNAQGPVQ